MQGGVARGGSTFGALEFGFNISTIVIGVSKEIDGFLKNTHCFCCTFKSLKIVFAISVWMNKAATVVKI